MALLVWVAMATAFWHFTIFVPDRFPGGLVGGFVAANAAAVVAGVVANGGSLPPLAVVGFIDAVAGGAGGLIGLAAAYAYGHRTQRDAED